MSATGGSGAAAGHTIGDRVRIDLTDGVADVRLIRPDKMNALDNGMFAALAETPSVLRGMPGLRAVVLSGEGRAFCAGIDLDSVGAMMQGAGVSGLMDRTHGISNIYQYVAMGWRELDVPVIAALHGVAFGGGLQIALGADIRVCAPDMKLSVMEIRWALVPDMGGTVLLRSMVREDMVRDLVFTGRQFTGTEAQAMGIATHVDENPHAAAMRIAHGIARQSPRAVRAAKALLNRTLGASPEAALLAESELQSPLVGGPDQIEAVTAHLQKRAPVFTDPE